MTSIVQVLEPADVASLTANISDAASLRLVSRLIEGQVTVLQAQLNQLQQAQAALNERAKQVEG